MINNKNLFLIYGHILWIFHLYLSNFLQITFDRFNFRRFFLELKVFNIFVCKNVKWNK